MPVLPNCGQAIVDIRKLEDYCLSLVHPYGRHKARIFRAALGIGQDDAAWLRNALLQGIRTEEATERVTNAFGTRWRVDVTVARNRLRATVRTVWIVRVGEDVPRLVTCWVL